MGEYALGQPVPRSKDPRLLKGGGRYVDDIVLECMAFGYVLRSLHAHSKIPLIDTSEAKAAVALHFSHYNFVRLHKTLRVTPAMAAGVSGR